MAAQYIPIKRISSLDTPIKAEKLDGSLFTTENQAHEFIISVRKNGVKQTVTGSVSGKFIRANGTTIFLQGSIVDGDAVVRLHQDCYNVQGRFTFNIFNTQSGVTTCIYSAVGKIDMGSTETVIDAGDVVPDISDVVAKQEEMTQVIADARAATSAASQAATEGENKFVRFDASQTLTEAQKGTARTNIDSPSNAEITELKGAIDNTIDELESVEDYAIKTTFPSSTSVPNIPDIITFTGGGYLASGTPGIYFYNNSNYKGYYLIPTKKIKVYVDLPGSGSLGAHMLGIGSSFTGLEAHSNYTTLKCSSNTVYKSQDSNIPTTEENAVTIPAGGVLAVAWSGSGTMKLYGIVTEKGMGDPLKQDIQNLIEIAMTPAENKIDAIADYTVQESPVSIGVLQIPGVVSSAGHYAAHASAGISMYANAGYNSCYFLADKEYTVYLDNDTITNNVMVGVGTGYTGISQHSNYYDLLCASNTVYRSQDGNAPRTPETAVTVPAGGVLAVSWAGDQALKIYGFATELTIGDPLKADVQDLINEGSEECLISGNGTNVDITCGRLKFQVRHIIDNSINVNCWRLYYGYLLKDGTQYTLWGASDADGVIKLSGEDDFLGGYHGDEITTGIRMLIDGVEADISQAIAKTGFRNIDIFVSSNLFHDSNSQQAGTQCFTREKHIHFEKDKLQLLNVWTVIEAVDVITAFVGMFSVDRVSGSENNFIIGYTTDTDAMLKADNVATVYSPNLHSATFFTKGGTVKMQDYGCFGGNYSAQVMYYSNSNRLKFYANNNPGQVQSGAVFAGGYILEAE